MKVHKLAIHGEQELGDEILFMSLLKKAMSHSQARSSSSAPTGWWTSSKIVSACAATKTMQALSPRREPDAAVPMASLPMVLGLPDGKPFLKRSGHARTSAHSSGSHGGAALAQKGQYLGTNAQD